MMEEVDLSDDAPVQRPKCFESQISVDYGPPDPQIQIELERLNTCTDLINKLEVDLDEGRMMFRQMLSESTQTIDSLSKKLGKCVEQARPYYDARIRAKQSMSECQKSAVRFERAVSQHTAAREMVQLAEEGLLTRGCIFDSTWQEMLNHATTKVNDAEREKIESTNEHREKSGKYHDAELHVKLLQKQLKRAISKSRPYFEMKAAINQRLEEQKRHIKELEEAVTLAKSGYAQALINLENISEHIHKERENNGMIGIRGVGVGAESSIASELNEVAKQSLYSPASENNEQISTYVDNRSNWISESNEDKRVELSITSKNASEWQFLPPRELSNINCLAVDDRESIISDTESLTSIEMLSEDAIANLMLENELHEASEALERLPERVHPVAASALIPGSNKESTLGKVDTINSNESSHSHTQYEANSSLTDPSTKSCGNNTPKESPSHLNLHQSDVSTTNIPVAATNSNDSRLEGLSVRPSSLGLEPTRNNEPDSFFMKSPSSEPAATEGQLETNSTSNSSVASNCSELSSTEEAFLGYVPLEHSVED